MYPIIHSFWIFLWLLILCCDFQHSSATIGIVTVALHVHTSYSIKLDCVNSTFQTLSRLWKLISMCCVRENHKASFSHRIGWVPISYSKSDAQHTTGEFWSPHPCTLASPLIWWVITHWKSSRVTIHVITVQLDLNTHHPIQFDCVTHEHNQRSPVSDMRQNRRKFVKSMFNGPMKKLAKTCVWLWTNNRRTEWRKWMMRCWPYKTESLIASPHWTRFFCERNSFD
jgi:hypothetical protein